MGAFVDALDAMLREIEGELPGALLDATQVTVDAAKTGHPWRNRTGRLEASIRSEGVRGSLRGGYVLTIVGATPYGSYLEEGWDTGYSLSGGHVSISSSQWAFLLPAWERTADHVARDVEARLYAAVT